MKVADFDPANSGLKKAIPTKILAMYTGMVENGYIRAKNRQFTFLTIGLGFNMQLVLFSEIIEILATMLLFFLFKEIQYFYLCLAHSFGDVQLVVSPC